MASNSMVLPPMAPFPAASWRAHLVPDEWERCLDAWLQLTAAHLSLSTSNFERISVKDESLQRFLFSYFEQIALSEESSLIEESLKPKKLHRQCFILAHRVLDSSPPPELLLHWQFLADASKIYSPGNAVKLLSLASRIGYTTLESSMAVTKTFIIKQLDSGIKGDLKSTEEQLKRLNHLLNSSTSAAEFFLAGSDFLDCLINGYKVTNPPLRKTITTTAYLCLIGLVKGEKPNFSSLIDQLYSLKTAADAHKTGPINANDSLVPELITVTPLIKQIRKKVDDNGSNLNRANAVLTALETFRKPRGERWPAQPVKRKIDKGKAPALSDDNLGEIHVHRMSLISQIQDLFPDLGSAFIVKLLDAYNDDAEIVIAQLLEGSLLADLEGLDRSEALKPTSHAASDPLIALSPHSPTELPIRRNFYDNDEFDNLAVSSSQIHIGQRNPDQTADNLLSDRSNAPKKAAILAALAVFDADDDERDDTYDVEDVGGTVDSTTNPEDRDAERHGIENNANDKVLFEAYKATPGNFARDAATRRSQVRIDLRNQTGLTDEAIEGWAIMLTRDPKQVQMRRLEAKFSSHKGVQHELVSTAWRASSGNEDSDADGRGRGNRGFRGRGGGSSGGGGRGRGNVAGPTGDKDTEAARHKKESNKASKANHNRRDQRAKKMARGGFPG